jgi:hypothetical protein
MWHANRLRGIAIPAAVISLAAIGAIATPARSAPMLAPAAATSFTIAGALSGVSATSASNAWAVGYTGSASDPKILILHWNGRKWSQVTSQSPLSGELLSVTAVSADNAWAVGETDADSAILVMHWNGRAWSRPAGVPQVPGKLDDVVVSGNSVWAVGGTDDLLSSLILHRTGNRWYVVPAEAPANSQLYGIVVTGRNTAIAGGGSRIPGGRRGLIMRWNGTVWKSAANPLQGANNILYHLTGGPSGAIWAVGTDFSQKLTSESATSMLWNGKTWRKVPVGPLPQSSVLDGVAFVPGGTAWAVGFSFINALIMRWTGHGWTQLPTPEDGLVSDLFSVAATSAGNAWAVGYVYPHSQAETLILHWNGNTWS